MAWYALAKDLNSAQPGSDEVGAIVRLENVYGDAVPKIEKTAVTQSVASLLKSAADVEFTVTPSVVSETDETMTTKNLPLSEFKVMDLGLSFTSDVNKDDTTYTQPSQSAGHDEPTYKITEVILDGSASQVTEFLDYNISNASISAEVIWHFADGTSTKTDSMTVSGGSAVTFPAPNGKTALSFDVNYFSTQVKTATNEKIGRASCRERV